MNLLWRAGSSEQYSPQLIRFTKTADELIRDFERWIEPRLSPNGEFSDLAGWASKLAGACVRISAILHCCEQVALEPIRSPTDSEVSDRTVQAAVRLCREYLLPHARAALGMMKANPLNPAAQRVVDLLHAWPTKTISRREIQRKSGRLFERAEEMDPVLELLVQYGYLRSTSAWQEQTGKGHKSPQFAINPRMSRGTQH